MTGPPPRPPRSTGGGVGLRSLVLLVVVLLGGAVGACSSGDGSGPEADGPRPSLEVTPATGLVDGDDVRLEGAGWPAGAGLQVATCQVATVRCAVGEVGVEAGDDGDLDVETVATATFVSWSGEPVDCRAVACELRVERDDGPVGARLTFDPEAPLSPSPTLTAWPASGLVDEARVDVRAEHLAPGAQVGFALCEAGARHAFDDRCSVYDAGLLEEEHPGLGWTVAGDGTVVAALRARVDAYAYDRRVDCRVERCELVVTVLGAVLARAPVSFDRRAEVLGPARLTVSPARGLASGDRVEVAGSGFYAGEAVLLEQCAADSTAETCVGGPSERWVADDEGRFTGTFVVRRFAATDFQPVDCLAVDCVLRADRAAFVPLQARSAEATVRVER